MSSNSENELRAEREADQVGVVGLVDGPQMALEHAERLLVLTPEDGEARGLRRRSSARATRGGPARPRGTPRARRAGLLGGDRRLGVPHPGVEAAQLRRQHALRLRRLVRPVAQIADPGVDARLVACRDRLRRGPGGRAARATSVARTMSSGHRDTFAPPRTALPGYESSARSASAASRRSGPTEAR